MALYPVDEELADARSKFVELRAEVRLRLASDVITSIDTKIEDDMAARAAREKALAEGPASGLDDEPVPVEPEPQMEKVKWKLPVVLSLAGAGVASAAVGGVMFGVSGGQMRDAEGLREGLGDSGCPEPSTSADCQRLNDKVEDSDRSFNLGVAGLIGAGAFVVSALAVQLVVPKEREVATVARPLASFDPQSKSVFVGFAGAF